MGVSDDISRYLRHKKLRYHYHWWSRYYYYLLKSDSIAPVLLFPSSKKYFDKLQEKIGQTRSADRIEEGSWWEVVVRELNRLSYDYARELQVETGKPYSKYYTDGRLAYDLPYEESPPTRLLALNLILSYWLGWLDTSRSHYLDSEPISAWRRIEEAYEGREQIDLDRSMLVLHLQKLEII